ncbi:MAG: sulfite oxidase [Opitutaceae bacterium]|nr:sulfite oxidase [Opitutaceae bacterium]
MPAGGHPHAAPTPAHYGMIVRQAEPVNLEMPFGSLDQFVTRTEDFFVRCHFPIPEITRDRWRLRIRGLVQRPVELAFDELQAMPASSVTATLECAGNGRVFLSPSVGGAQWERGAVGNAVWTGVPLGYVLERAGLPAEASEIILTGTDEGEIEAPPRPGGRIRYARSLPLGKATGDVLLAWQMNGADLTPAHGFPLRAIVPGWYGMASVKWLSDIIVTDRPFQGYYQSVDYAYWQRSTGEPSLVPITELHVKSQIARPGPCERVPRGGAYLVRGAAWTCEAEIVRVEVSTDGGLHWSDARLGRHTDRHAWRLWEYDWAIPREPGRTTLMTRAHDSKGRTQPAKRDPDRGAYMINEVLGLDVMVQ